jgi:PleD family two-component response regulator
LQISGLRREGKDQLIRNRQVGFENTAGSNETLDPSLLIRVTAHVPSRGEGMEHADEGVCYEPPSVKTILLVEDDPATALRLGERLAQQPDSQVIFASDGLTALKFMRSCKPDLVLLDERLLASNGIDLGPRLCVMQDLLDIPLLLLSLDFP